MQKPKKFLTRMALFMALVLAVAAVLKDPIRSAFFANPALNGVILAVLLIGALYAARRVTDLNREVAWIKAFKKQEVASSAHPPRLMAPAAALLVKSAEGRMRLSALSMRSVLDGIASRLEESREISRYMTGLLIFLGLLGTFWGLLGTIGSIGSTINGLSVDGADMALMFDELKSGLEAPLAGMGTAFSSSLFGLAGSLVLGFLDLQASQAQTRFYNDVEDWLATVTHLSRGEEGTVIGGGSSPGGYTAALMEQTAEGIDKLSRTMVRADEGRAQLHESLTGFAQSMTTLSDKIEEGRSSEQAGSKALAQAIESLAQKESAPVAPAMDQATRDHIRNMDVTLKQMAMDQARSSELLVDELRAELKLLARTIAVSLEEREGPTRPPEAKPQQDDEHPFLKVGGAPVDEDDLK